MFSFLGKWPQSKDLMVRHGTTLVVWTASSLAICPLWLHRSGWRNNPYRAAFGQWSSQCREIDMSSLQIRSHSEKTTVHGKHLNYSELHWPNDSIERNLIDALWRSVRGSWPWSWLNLATNIKLPWSINTYTRGRWDIRQLSMSMTVW